ncbi:MAG: hypothetical protein H7235_00270 [Bdellovibrionaceae bacterium]|nr:hypothetical protein [Pseudobdellovibrionaceae bacterium]
MKFKNIPKWILTHLSVLTMVLMPVAQGLAAEKQQQDISKAMVQNAIYEMGLNKSTTYGEFFKKNKDKYPPRLQKELEPYFAQFSDQMMPQFDVGTAKGSDGKTYPTLRISQNGELHNVQIFGETDRYAKFNNTNLTEVDLINFDDALIRLSAGDVKLRQQLEATKTTMKSSQKSFVGFPDVTKDSWAKLTPEQRAGYVISMRLLYNDAHGVLLASSKNKKPTKKGKKFSFLESFMGEEAYAIPSSEPDWENIDTAAGNSAAATSVSKAPNQGLDSCLVAGYVTTYKGKVCKYSEMIKNYSDVSSLSRKAYASCGSGTKIACNPLVFGTPGGNPICIDRKDNDDVQKATHYEGPCERANHTNSKISFLNDESNKSARYDSKNVNKTSDQIKAEAKSEQEKAMYQSTKDYIAGVLKFKDPSLHALFIDNKPNEQVINELLQINKDFNSEISQATEACKIASSKKGYHEKNFWGACDQLQRRFIFVAEYLSKNPGCKDGKPVDSTTLKCSCVDGNNVIPGGECKATPPNPPVVTSGDPTPVKPGSVDPGKCDPVCTSDESCKLQEKTDDGIEVWQCVSKKVVDSKKKKGGFGKFLNAALPWVVGVGALVGMYFLFKPKKVKLNPAGDRCPDGTNAPCVNSCVSPQVYFSGMGCKCAACPPGQTIINAKTCECGMQGNDVKIVCPNGVTIVDKLEDCPKALYTCWDGSQVANAINCPEKPAAPGESKTKTKR